MRYDMAYVDHAIPDVDDRVRFEGSFLSGSQNHINLDYLEYDGERKPSLGACVYVASIGLASTNIMSSCLFFLELLRNILNIPSLFNEKATICAIPGSRLALISLLLNLC